MEGLIYEGKFAFQNRFRASLIVGSNLPFLLCFTLYLRAIFQVKAPGRRGGGGPYILRTDLTEGFLRYRFAGLMEGLIFGILRYFLRHGPR